jgi:hypothetical protein
MKVLLIHGTTVNNPSQIHDKLVELGIDVTYEYKDAKDVDIVIICQNEHRIENYKKYINVYSINIENTIRQAIYFNKDVYWIDKNHNLHNFNKHSRDINPPYYSIVFNELVNGWELLANNSQKQNKALTNTVSVSTGKLQINKKLLLCQLKKNTFKQRKTKITI